MADSFGKISAQSISGMRAQAYRMQVVSENIANIDTHGYRRKLVSFENTYDSTARADLVQVDRVFLDSKPGAELFDPHHPFADENGYVRMSNVNLMTEFADAREANRSYEAGLQVFRQARDMYNSLLDILRR
ncbi:MAG: flagellar basal body rod protein FlgC [Pseudomonadota bacterium]